MQRCPQCQFIYEDDQSRCDMDGTVLVHDSHPLPRLQALAVTTASEPTKRSSLRRVVPFAAALVLAVVMALVYYVSVNRSSRAASRTGITTVETPATIAEPTPATATNTVSASQDTKNETSAEKSGDGAKSTKETAPVVNSESKKAESSSAKKPATTPRSQSNNQPRSTSTEPAEKDSKLRSALKKTGRFFKRVLN